MSNSRRDVGTRKISFFHGLASFLVKRGLTPNQISVSSAVFSILGGLSFYFAADNEGLCRALFLVGGALCIQLRLICNLIDGLMAVECGLKTPAGELFNDVPDRISDVAALMGAGLFAQSLCPYMIHIAWMAAVAAIMTAYTRVLGASMTGAHDFCGPMAKQHRMFVITLGAVGSLVEMIFSSPPYSMSVALAIVLLGSIYTCVRRLVRIYRKLN